MIDWKQVMKESPVEWLLEENNPSVRYFTLRDILGKGASDPQITAARNAIMESSAVNKILQKQQPDGHWLQPESPYLPKYKASYWQIMILGQVGAVKTDERVTRACEYAFRFQTAEGAFTSQTHGMLKREYEWRLKKGRTLPPFNQWVPDIIREQQLSCLTGNMSAALMRLGYEGDGRVDKALSWLVEIQNADGGWLCPYWRAHVNDKHGCFYGTICALEAFSEVKKENLTAAMKKTIAEGAEFVLMHRLFKADHHGYKVINPAWLKLTFPWFYGYNILRGLDVLTKLGYTRDKRLDDAVELLLQKRQKNGAWILENAPVGRMHINLEMKGKPSKWTTLIALRTLRRISQAQVRLPYLPH